MSQLENFATDHELSICLLASFRLQYLVLNLQALLVAIFRVKRVNLSQIGWRGCCLHSAIYDSQSLESLMHFTWCLYHWVIQRRSTHMTSSLIIHSNAVSCALSFNMFLASLPLCRVCESRAVTEIEDGGENLMHVMVLTNVFHVISLYCHDFLLSNPVYLDDDYNSARIIFQPMMNLDFCFIYFESTIFLVWSWTKNPTGPCRKTCIRDDFAIHVYVAVFFTVIGWDFRTYSFQGSIKAANSDPF